MLKNSFKISPMKIGKIAELRQGAKRQTKFELETQLLNAKQVYNG